ERGAGRHAAAESACSRAAAFAAPGTDVFWAGPLGADDDATCGTHLDAADNAADDCSGSDALLVDAADGAAVAAPGTDAPLADPAGVDDGARAAEDPARLHPRSPRRGAGCRSRAGSDELAQRRGCPFADAEHGARRRG